MPMLVQTVDEEAGQHSDHDNRRHDNRRQQRAKSEDVPLSPAVAAAVNEYKRVRSLDDQRTLNSSQSLFWLTLYLLYCYHLLTPSKVTSINSLLCLTSHHNSRHPATTPHL